MPKPFRFHDPYFFRAKKLKYRARSAFKLIEIQEKFQIITPGMQVLDIGSAPGSFLQVIGQILKNNGTIVGIDIQKIDPNFGYANIHLLKADILSFDTIAAFFKTIPCESFDCITSDIAPATTGITGVDQYRSVELNLAILPVAERFLKKDGNLLLKVFVGEDVGDLIGPVKSLFSKLTRYKPRACRDRSFEEYFLCQGKK